MAETLYFGLTTGTGLSTLGEEYCDILQVAGALQTARTKATQSLQLETLGSTKAGAVHARLCQTELLEPRAACCVLATVSVRHWLPVFCRASWGRALHPAAGNARLSGDTHAVPD